jgi:hypothetical protein
MQDSQFARPLTAHAPYRSGHGRALAVTMLLALSAAVSLLSVLTSVARISSGTVADPTSDEPTVFDFLDFGVGLIHTVVFVTTVVLFCMWLHRAYSNLPALGNPKQALKHSAAWAVGSFFVPIANLFIPYRAVRETWAKSDPGVAVDNYVAPQEPSSPSIMTLWWAFWIISNIVSNAAFRFSLNAKTAGEATVVAWLELFGELLAIPAAVFAILVVREIDRRQEERSRRVTYVPNLPPPPPLFSAPPAARP